MDTPLAGEHISSFAPDRKAQAGQTAAVGPEQQWTLSVLTPARRGYLPYGDNAWALLSLKAQSRIPAEGGEWEVLRVLDREKVKTDGTFLDEWLNSSVVYPTLRTMRIDESLEILLPAGTHSEFDNEKDLKVEITLHDHFLLLEAWPDETPKVSVFLSQRGKTAAWKPGNMDVVGVHYRMECADDGEVVYDTRAMGTPHIFTIGCGDVIPGLDLGVMKFSIRQMGSIEIDPIAGFGSHELTKDLEVLCQKQGKGGVYMYEGVKEVFDGPLADPRIGRTTVLEQAEPTDGVAPPPPPRDPHFQLIPSSIDMFQYADRLVGRKLILKDVHIEQLYSLDNSSVYHHRDRLEYVDHIQSIAKRFFGVKDLIRAERIYSEASVVLSECQGSDYDSTLRRAQEGRVLCNQGLVYLKLGQLERAEESLQTLLKSHADHAKACYLMGRVKEAQDDDVGAELWLRRSWRIEANNQEVTLALRRLLKKQKNNAAEERQRMQDMLAAGNFGEDRDQPAYVKIDKEVDLPVDAAVNNEMLNTFGISIEKVDKPVGGVTPPTKDCSPTHQSTAENIVTL